MLITVRVLFRHAHRARRGEREPDERPSPPERVRASAASRIADGGGGASRGTPRGGPGAVGDRLLRGPSPRRAPRAALRGRRPRRRGHPRPPLVGRRRGPGRAEEREGDAHGSDHGAPARLPDRAEGAHGPRRGRLRLRPAPDRPFTPTYMRKRAIRAWEAENKKRTEKPPSAARSRSYSSPSACTSAATRSSRSCTTPASRWRRSATSSGTRPCT